MNSDHKFNINRGILKLKIIFNILKKMEFQELVLLYIVYLGLFGLPLVVLFWKRRSREISREPCEQEGDSNDLIENDELKGNKEVENVTSETQMINYTPGHKMEMFPNKELNKEEKMKELEIQKQQLERIFSLLKEVESMHDNSLYIKRDSIPKAINEEYLKNTIQSQIKLYGLH
jgi:hypothetical protein